MVWQFSVRAGRVRMTNSTFKKVLLALSVLITLSRNGESANILGLFTSLSPSHLIVEMSVVKALAEQGHNVTVVVALKPTVTHENITVIHVPIGEAGERDLHKMVGKMASQDNSNVVLSMIRMVGQAITIFDHMFNIMQQQSVKNFYENPSTKFDLVIIGVFMSNYQLGLGYKLKAPIVMVAPMAPMEIIYDMLGNPSELAYVPGLNVALEKGQVMTFPQRLKNYVYSLSVRIFKLIIESNNSKYYRSLYGDDPNMPSYGDLHKNVSLIFFNSHGLSEGPIRPNVPALIEMGGIQIKDKPDPLPQHMEEFLNNAPDGAILLSLGSNVKGSHIKPDIVRKMFNVLSNIKQRVIWKWEDLNETPGKSDNILYSKWLPQDDILAHANIKLFITHAGKGGITEAQYHGKPMLALPMFGDQPNNAEMMAKKGFGLTLSMLQLEEEEFKEKLFRLLNEPQLTENVQRFSALYRDRPLTARQTVVYWTEYVLRHHGAAHMQSPFVHMSFIAAYNLDVHALLLTGLVIFMLVLKVVISFIYKKFRGQRTSKQASKKKQKKH